MKVELNPRTNTFSGNLLAKEMVDSYSQSKVFSYTFATPNNTTSSSATATQYKGIFSILNTDDIVPQMPLKEWGFTNYGQIREISVTDKYEDKKLFGNVKKGTFEWLTGRDYNNDGGTKRTLNAFSKVATSRNAIYQRDYNLSKMNNYIDPLDDVIYKLANRHLTFEGYKSGIGFRLSRHVYQKNDSSSTLGYFYQTPAFLMQDLANLAGKEKNYYIAGHSVAPQYVLAKGSFILTSGFGGNVPIIGGMAHPHLPQTYYLIAKNNFVALT